MRNFKGLWISKTIVITVVLVVLLAFFGMGMALWGTISVARTATQQAVVAKSIADCRGAAAAQVQDYLGDELDSLTATVVGLAKRPTDPVEAQKEIQAALDSAAKVQPLYKAARDVYKKSIDACNR